MYDFLVFCERTGRSWSEPRRLGEPSIVAAYRESALQSKQQTSTINNRLDLLVAFYRFAAKKGYISEVPFEMEERRKPLIHGPQVTRKTPSTATAIVPDVKLKATRKILKMLSYSQVEKFLGALSAKNRTHRLMAELQLATGIRVEELVSFPANLIVDPRVHPLTRHAFAVTLSPTEMLTKGNVQRTVHVPVKLMQSLWQHVAVIRPQNIDREAAHRPELFLTKEGTSYKTRTIWKIYTDLQPAIGFHVNPHMLRHTFATHTIASLSQTRNIGYALLYLRDRLGHASIKTTERYLHYVDDLSLDAFRRYQLETDGILEADNG